MKRWVWGGAATWLVVVVLGSGLAWLAINQAGGQVTSAGLPAGPGSTSTNGTAQPPPRRTPTPAPTPSASTAPSSPSASDPAVTVRSWNGAPGSLTVSCNGTTGRLLSATPADGWHAERESEGAEVRVKFERSGSEVSVRATCTDSGPTFRVEDRDDD